MPAMFPWPKMPKHPAKNRWVSPSLSTYFCVRNRTTACAVVRRIVPLIAPSSGRDTLRLHRTDPAGIYQWGERRVKEDWGREERIGQPQPERLSVSSQQA